MRDRGEHYHGLPLTPCSPPLTIKGIELLEETCKDNAWSLGRENAWVSAWLAHPEPLGAHGWVWQVLPTMHKNYLLPHLCFHRTILACHVVLRSPVYLSSSLMFSDWHSYWISLIPMSFISDIQRMVLKLWGMTPPPHMGTTVLKLQLLSFHISGVDHELIFLKS